MRITVDRNQCEANGICQDLAPGVFSLDDDDQLHLLVSDVPTEMVSDAEAAIYSCPKQALSVEAT